MTEPTPITPELLRALPLPRHGSEDDKDARGKVLVIAGSRPVPGAALLAAVAALRAGAGKLQIATVESIASQLGLMVPEAMVIALPETTDGDIAAAAADILCPKIERRDAVLLGPGMLDPELAAVLAARLLEKPGDAGFVLDAGALTALKPIALAPARGRTVLTPHAGEMVALIGQRREEIESDPLAAVRLAARDLGCFVALKGGCTRIAGPDGQVWIYSDGNVGLATSGSGDTLAGVVAGLLARGCNPHVAAIWGVWLHGEAGNHLAARHGPVGFLARELLAEIPSLMAEFG